MAGPNGCFRVPVAAAEHRSKNRGCRSPPVRARGALSAPGELGERRFLREAQGSREAAGGFGAAFSLVTFFWPCKRKTPAVGQPPTSSFSDHRRKAIQLARGIGFHTRPSSSRHPRQPLFTAAGYPAAASAWTTAFGSTPPRTVAVPLLRSNRASI